MSKDKVISWGIIGCGDVTEKKSGPAFNKVPNSKLVAVMRRDAEKAADYAKRHAVPKYYSDAQELINDPDINAVYIATPPKYHEEYTLQALQAGKFVYVEKPVTINTTSCKKMIEYTNTFKGKVSVAHYRRTLPMFLSIKKIIKEGRIGNVKLIELNMLQPHQSSIIASTTENWRVDPIIAGGGLFFDLAPHQLDIITYIFGNYIHCSGRAFNQAKLYAAEDTVVGYIQLPGNIAFTGNWCFTVPEHVKEDSCRIIGETGSISFPFFGNQIELVNKNGKQLFSFEHPEHIQQPMIEKVVGYLLENGQNPCSLEESLVSLEIMECFCANA
jgi:predicted dehydrogenase